MLFAFQSMTNAYLAGTCVALVAGIMGYFMVLRSQSFAGHSLANVGFAGAAGATLIGAPAIPGLFVAGALAALGINWLSGRRRQSDIAVGAILTASLALGYLFIHLATKEYAATIYDALFGNVLLITSDQTTLIFWCTLVAIAIMAVIGRPLLFASVDPDVAAARGVAVRALGLGYLLLLALVVAVAVQIVGVLLIFALLVTPAAIALQLTARPGRAILLAAGFALVFVWAGLAAGYLTPYPVGFFISTFAFATYVMVNVWRSIVRNAFQMSDSVGAQ